jgi:hypothetical protein
MLLTAIKILHTLVVVVMFTAILFLLYSGITGQLSKWTTIAFVVISIEVVIYVGNGFRCPLTKMAERLTPAGHPVFDILLPRWMADRIVVVSTPLLGMACLLLLWRLLQSQ